MKYVIIENHESGQFYPVVFADELVHADMVKKGQSVHSAGMLEIEAQSQRVRISGHSESLKIGPSKLDKTLLEFFIFKGLAGLGLSNYLMFLRLKGESPEKQTRRLIKKP